MVWQVTEAAPAPVVVPAAAGQVMPLLLQQLDTALHLVQIEAARQAHTALTLLC